MLLVHQLINTPNISAQLRICSYTRFVLYLKGNEANNLKEQSKGIRDKETHKARLQETITKNYPPSHDKFADKIGSNHNIKHTSHMKISTFFHSRDHQSGAHETKDETAHHQDQVNDSRTK